MESVVMVEPDGATHVAAYVVFDDMILIQRRAADRRFLPGAWDVIGGAIEGHETAIDALLREVSEEAGLEVAAVSDWIIRTEFEADGRTCVEIGALVWPRGGGLKLKLEAGKASAFAFVGDIASFVEDNEARGYVPLFGETVGVALQKLRSGVDLGRRSVAEFD
ncbi:MAG TPA: NUDIX domain-containing protein [Glycomyces sp.]|nr:NUDIX domain-containing protein [Glycomyces sp.]